MKNHLAGSLSPYLLQHEDNPVDWYPWSEEAFRKAKSENKPIFLSIGYSACHWCHVMERESFENETVASFLNENFISIKVDREERPDVDDIYMNAVQMFTGSGGWPLTVFLTPDLKPFHGGTYFPPESRFGRPGFLELLKEIERVFRTQRNQVENSAAQMTSQLKSFDSHSTGAGEYDRTIIENAVKYLKDNYDAAYGGFGGAPKFPPTGQLNLLMRIYKRNKDTDLLKIVEHTLTRMAQGGIFDQIGGGFHRYSVDEKWLAPHFEKMLYDNALLTVNYLDLYLITKNRFFADIARLTLDWVLREMQDGSGGFYSSLDADSEGEEGLFYLWEYDQFRKILGNDTSELMNEVYGITRKGNFEGNTNILTFGADLQKIAAEWNLTVEELREKVNVNRHKLLKSRHQRIRPHTDDKILTDWNSLIITAFARGYRALGNPEYLKAAENAADFLLREMFNSENLFHNFRDGKADINGLLDDYAYLTEGLIELYQAGFDERYFVQAKLVASRLKEKFQDDTNDGFFQTPADRLDLLYRSKQAYDSSTPSGNAVAAGAFFNIYKLTYDDQYRDIAQNTVKLYSKQAREHPEGFFRTIALIDDLTMPLKQVAIILAKDSEMDEDMIGMLNSQYNPGLIIAAKDENQNSKIELLDNREVIGKENTAYYCIDFSCRLPVTLSARLKEIMKKSVF
ncbi:MAG: thioredoxin domain-containing protein [Candidatus Hatepunaea meridiana]|nr:thioredoxin domain-containing protein [Candidatus Hatepunaea meridiana]